MCLFHSYTCWFVSILQYIILIFNCLTVKTYNAGVCVHLNKINTQMFVCLNNERVCQSSSIKLSVLVCLTKETRLENSQKKKKIKVNAVINTVIHTLRIAGLKLCASLRRELRSCWKPWSSGGEAWWTPTEPLVPTDPVPTGVVPCCCRRHTLVLITNNRSHKSNWTT